MAKEFNTTVTCNAERHYMVDISSKMKYVDDLIERAKYFTINRARQFGKSTVLKYIYENLSDRYYVVPISFETTSSYAWESEEGFVDNVCQKIAKAFSTIKTNVPEYQKLWTEARSLKKFDNLSNFITEFCPRTDKPVILTIDEMDKSLDNQLFLNFLGMLRNSYLNREEMGMNSTFHSVILAGVYDVKNLKLKIRPDAEKKYNSPWNVAADFNLDMTFHPHEIAQMLSDYEADYHTGMDIKAISEEIYRYTFGYPVLVSALCKIIDEQLDKDWTLDGILKSVKTLMKSTEFTLTDDLSKNLNNYPELHKYLFDISVNGAQYSFSPLDPVMKMAHMFGYIKEKDGQVVIHNLFFEEAMHLYFTEEYKRKNSFMDTMSRSVYIQNGTLNMENIIRRFSDLMHEEYRDRDQKFIEQQGRLLFLCYLKPIINGTGFYYVEPQTRENARMDLVVTYNHKEYIIELKIWHGTKYETDGKVQLAEYLDAKNISEGYLVTFSFLKNKTYCEPEWKVQDGKRIFEAVI
ncbi:MAG: AAA-like domain-containing protein [Bacteroidales bacterium]|nr:AAA-like domain-containing protein [Bacteroidales bacterium]